MGINKSKARKYLAMVSHEGFGKTESDDQLLFDFAREEEKETGK